MALTLTASATYWQQGDFIEVQAFITDPDSELYLPNKLSSGTTTLVHAENYDISQLFFDRFNGNEDGGFKMMFLHPPHIRNISVRIEATMDTGEELDVTIPVLLERTDFTESLSPNTGGLKDGGRTSGLAGEEN